MTSDDRAPSPLRTAGPVGPPPGAVPEQTPDGPTDRCRPDSVVALFHAVAASVAPGRPAITAGSATVDHPALAARVRQVASAVAAAPSETAAGPVGLALTHGVDALVGVLGVLAAGRAVVPLDPQLPADRLVEIASLATARLVLLDGRSDSGAGASVNTALRRAVPHALDVTALPPAPPASRAAIDPADPACVLFTSGSTGSPKGVVHSHRLLLHDARLGADVVGVTADDRVGVALPYSFSAGLSACLWALTTGASLYLFDPRTEGVAALADRIDEHGVTTLHASPTLLRGLVSRLPAGRRLPTLRLVTTSGEPLHGRDVTAARAHLAPDAVIVNWAGASEIASLAMHRVGPDEAVPDGPLPAGRPVPGKDVRIVGDDGAALPAGQVGEITVTSAFLSDGYWALDDLTAARFTRLGATTTYRSGDRGVLHADGTLELRGRLDAAVKVRGYLVEPAEIENALRTCPNVAEAAVVADSTAGHPRLVAYVGAPGRPVQTAVVRRHLRERLPEYMVPARVVVLPALPRDERGKLARARLPPVRWAADTGGRPPASAWEATVADVWSEILHVDGIGRDDDFFALGGDSLAVVDMLAVMGSRLSRTVATADLVAAPTLGEFASRCHAPRGPRRLVHSTLVPLREGGPRSPLFCVAGAAGLGVAFCALAAQLPAGRPVYALQGDGVENRRLPAWSVRRVARRHLRAIRTVQPNGPYHLAGHSFGGLVAYEMAQQLVAAGETVGVLGLLDTFLPWMEADYAVHELADQAPSARAAFALRHHYVDCARWLFKTLPRMALVGPVRYAPLLHHRMLYAQANTAKRTYRPQPYAGPVTFFAAEEEVAATMSRWKRLVQGDLTVHRVDADHCGLLRDPVAGTVARLLTQDMAAREAQLSAPAQETT